MQNISVLNHIKMYFENLGNHPINFKLLFIGKNESPQNFRESIFLTLEEKMSIVVISKVIM